MQDLDLLKGIHIYTVSELNRDIKIILENTLTEVWVEGEISGINKTSKGTVFFTLKDQNSRLRCVLFGIYQTELNFTLTEGLKVLCFGKVGVYEKEGKYELIVKKIEPQGLGILWLKLEELKQKLEKEGLFDLAHKRQIPYLPTCIGIITSLFSAAIKDILKVLERRFKDLHIIIAPVRVQGQNAKYEIAQAIKDLNIFNKSLPKERKIQVIILSRGGGSLEDLWAFNDESLINKIFTMSVPVVSALGHNVDWTLCDYVADLRLS
ncbi:MAG: exodeoxyribonuclease VII large subunit, partial [Candidatus Omnitrophica bacterium]|nr:exodeoxyribonuclease VII large subunit [Candidatus Omnitrophota bacterium]